MSNLQGNAINIEGSGAQNTGSSEYTSKSKLLKIDFRTKNPIRQENDIMLNLNQIFFGDQGVRFLKFFEDKGFERNNILDIMIAEDGIAFITKDKIERLGGLEKFLDVFDSYLVSQGDPRLPLEIKAKCYKTLGIEIPKELKASDGSIRKDGTVKTDVSVHNEPQKPALSEVKDSNPVVCFTQQVKQRDAKAPVFEQLRQILAVGGDDIGKLIGERWAELKKSGVLKEELGQVR